MPQSACRFLAFLPPDRSALAIPRPLALRLGHLACNPLEPQSACRFLAFLPPDRCALAIPRPLALRLGRLACHPTLDVLLPGWRDCLRPYLPDFAPTCVDAARLAAETAVALEHADALTAAAQSVLRSEQPLREWLQHVPAALSAIAFGPHQGLLLLVLRVLASAADDAVVEEASACLLVLLRHPVNTVVEKTWLALCKLLAAGDESAEGSEATRRGLLRLLSRRTVLRHVVVHCMVQGEDERVRQVAEVLKAMLASDDASVATGAPSLADPEDAPVRNGAPGIRFGEGRCTLCARL